MGFVLALAIIIVLLLVLGVSGGKLMLIGLFAIGGIAALCVLFFLSGIIMLLASKKDRAKLIVVEARDKLKINYAYYMVGDKELRNIFPTDGVLKRAYRADKEISIRRIRLLGQDYVIDKLTIVIIILGFVLFSAMTFLVSTLISNNIMTPV